MASYEPVRAIQRGLAVLRGRKRTWSDHSRRTRRALRFPATYDGSHSRNTNRGKLHLPRCRRA